MYTAAVMTKSLQPLVAGICSGGPVTSRTSSGSEPLDALISLCFQCFALFRADFDGNKAGASVVLLSYAVLLRNMLRHVVLLFFGCLRLSEIKS